MGQWEYGSLAGGMKITFLRYTVDGDGTERKTWKSKDKTFHQVFAELGEQGWEVVHWMDSSSSYLFKRPKP